MPILWEILGTDETAEKAEAQRNFLRSLIENKRWKPPSSDGSGTYIEALGEIDKLMKEKPKGKQGVLKG